MACGVQVKLSFEKRADFDRRRLAFSIMVGVGNLPLCPLQFDLEFVFMIVKSYVQLYRYLELSYVQTSICFTADSKVDAVLQSSMSNGRPGTLDERRSWTALRRVG